MKLPLLGDIVARFPALRRLGGADSPRRIPIVQQLNNSECGPACLAMVLRYYGRHVEIDDLRQRLGDTGTGGVTARTLIETGRSYGLRGRGVRIRMDELKYLAPGAILHWDRNHFVVFERSKRNCLEVIDPVVGRRQVPIDKFVRSFGGVALVFERTNEFRAERQRGSALGPYLRGFFAESSVLARVVAATVIFQAVGLAFPALTGVIVDQVIPRNDQRLLVVIAIGIVVVLLCQVAMDIVRGHLLLHLRTSLDARMSLAFLDHLIALPYAFFQSRSTGDLMMRFSSNMVVREALGTGVLSAVLDGVVVTTYFVVLVMLSGKMAAVALLLALLRIAVFAVARTRQRELAAEALAMESRSQSYQVEILSGIETLKAMGAEQAAADRWSDLFVDVLNVSLARGRLDVLVDAIQSLIRLTSGAAILIVGATAVLRGELTLGTMLAASALATGFLNPLASLITVAGQWQRVETYLERIDDVFKTPTEVSEGSRSAARFEGRVRLDDVSFRYGDHGPLVIRNASIDIRPGQHVAVVGRSGAGKSTLANLILGLYSPTSGRILYDGQDITALDLRSVRRQVGVVTQAPALFRDTIRNNISMGDRGVSFAAVLEAAKAAQLHDEIMAMPMGYDTRLLERGSSVSGGQRQRIALARALVRRPAILLLDEATNALDALTEVAVQGSLEALGCTRIVIAHRLSTISRADLILVIDKGHIVQSGPHEQLIAAGGLYGELMSAQLQHEAPPVGGHGVAV